MVRIMEVDTLVMERKNIQDIIIQMEYVIEGYLI